jgi:hypothetical protein
VKLSVVSKSLFKSDDNLDFKMGKTELLAKGPTARHVLERAQYFLQTDPDLQGIVNDFTPEMFTATEIEVMGTPIGTDAYIKDVVAQNCIKIMRDVDKTEPLSDGFTHFQLVQKTMNTCTHLYSCIVCHTIHECKYNFTSPRAILNGVAHSYRYNHRKIYTPERYSRFFPSLGPG